MTKKQLAAYKMASKVDEEAQRREAHDTRMADYLAGLDKVKGYVPKNMTIMDITLDFLQQRIEELDKGLISPRFFVQWECVFYILSFDMEYKYTGVCESGFDEDTNLPLLDICGASDYLEEFDAQKRLRKIFNKYLTAAAAFAKRIGSSAYSGWLELLTESTFEFHCKFEKYEEKMTELTHLTWAENEVFKHNQMIAQKYPHTHKKGGKST